ncbi:hypothetical protein PHYSODRAFT_259375 [Phytophthora sojae]|uniref:RxLR effector protein n=1 Tax=Phytophthora sojae (strain P6497) TaxID=1094619 RepID=G4Z3U9_PHYSP|nr:hypothetical protein PHYSODRAFT_259375 [Phytophthora sojae]EGZ20808.1 hypothetical protein PHYSODRAFT_259375 [Phytophthora sojae]|eukprot:XP_009523525.1 hypothetical protein PHYSODRAFT_259375 [Phytophthora sojae]
MNLGNICAIAVLVLGFVASPTTATPGAAADRPNSNAASGSGPAAHNLRGARALATTSDGTTVYTENGGDASSTSASASSSDGSDATRVAGAFATTAGLVIAMSAYLL